MTNEKTLEGMTRQDISKKIKRCTKKVDYLENIIKRANLLKPSTQKVIKDILKENYLKDAIKCAADEEYHNAIRAYMKSGLDEKEAYAKVAKCAEHIGALFDAMDLYKKAKNNEGENRCRSKIEKPYEDAKYDIKLTPGGMEIRPKGNKKNAERIKEELLQAIESKIKEAGQYEKDFERGGSEGYIKTGSGTHKFGCLNYAASNYDGLASLYKELGKIKKSKESYKKAGDYYARCANNDDRLKNSIISAACAYEKAGDLQSAISMLYWDASEYERERNNGARDGRIKQAKELEKKLAKTYDQGGK